MKGREVDIQVYESLVTSNALTTSNTAKYFISSAPTEMVQVIRVITSSVTKVCMGLDKSHDCPFRFSSDMGHLLDFQVHLSATTDPDSRFLEPLSVSNQSGSVCVDGIASFCSFVNRRLCQINGIDSIVHTPF